MPVLLGLPGIGSSIDPSSAFSVSRRTSPVTPCVRVKTLCGCRHLVSATSPLGLARGECHTRLMCIEVMQRDKNP
jgi:hypothetical protein